MYESLTLLGDAEMRECYVGPGHMCVNIAMNIEQINLKTVYTRVSCLYVCMCTMCVPGTFGGQKRVSEPLELKLRWL